MRNISEIGAGVAVCIADLHRSDPEIRAAVAADLKRAGIRREGIGRLGIRLRGERRVYVTLGKIGKIIVRDVGAEIQMCKAVFFIHLQDVAHPFGIELEDLFLFVKMNAHKIALL